MSNQRAATPADGNKGTPFTLESYRDHVERSAALHPIAGFEVIDEPRIAEKNFCILRHDIDYLPERSLRLARIEAELGVRATYTVQLGSRFYIVFERETRAQPQEIHALGHYIGLHFDAVWHRIENEAALEDAIASEAELLSRLLGAPVRMFSFHDTTPFTVACQAPRYGGLWNAYAGILQSQVSYTSDSNGHWRYRSWHEALEERPPRLQVLTHPGWWIEEDATPGERICQVIEDRARLVWRTYSENLAVNGRENRTGIEAVEAALQAKLGQRGADIARRWLSGDRTAAFLMLCHAAAAGGADVSPQLDLITRLVHGEAAEAELAAAFDRLAQDPAVQA